MEPRALSNVNGTLIHDDNGHGRRTSTSSNFANNHTYPYALPTTPTGKDYDFSYLDNNNFDFSLTSSPAVTPYFLSQRSKLIQQTCPPKQTYRGFGLFEDVDRGGDYDDDVGFGDSVLSNIRLRDKLGVPGGRKSLAYV